LEKNISRPKNISLDPGNRLLFHYLQDAFASLPGSPFQKRKNYEKRPKEYLGMPFRYNLIPLVIG
jgi:hypothetical protein